MQLNGGMGWIKIATPTSQLSEHLMHLHEVSGSRETTDYSES